RTSLKVEALVAHFRTVPPADAAWAVFFLTGQRLKRLISGRVLRVWAAERAGLPEWLMADSHAAVGDSAETVALLLGERRGEGPDLPLHRWIEERILPLRGRPAEVQAEAVGSWWDELGPDEAFVLNKLLTGAFRVGVSRALVVRALAEVADLPRPTIAHRLMGEIRPSRQWFLDLLAAEDGRAEVSRPYPFCLASPLDQSADCLGDPSSWQVEWKWDGIRAQLIRRRGETFLWSRGEDLITTRFPEIAEAAERLPDGTVLDGEVLAWNRHGVMPFAALQTRIGRDRLSARLLKEIPAIFLAYDLLEAEGDDCRPQALEVRRARLRALLAAAPDRLRLSPTLEAAGWQEYAAWREEARARNVEGLMVKRLDSAYGVGRQRGAWWKWKVEPFTIDAVLVYAQAGSGRRANLFTDYTFALWSDNDLVPVAKAYSGLDNREIERLDRWIRRNTIERFGPVRSVRPQHVFELAFEGVSRSNRHKAGLAVRFPRITRWREDKPAADADRLATLAAMLPVEG
ncbi:MAG: ATP-dependent DNA ligase, partial [Geminicoccaceae bacterium]|nr:ATP-dependent DNA ligase [Geminicoccaceae bacterium]